MARLINPKCFCDIFGTAFRYLLDFVVQLVSHDQITPGGVMHYHSFSEAQPALNSRLTVLVKVITSFPEASVHQTFDANAVLSVDIDSSGKWIYESGLEPDEFDPVAWRPRNYPLDNDYIPGETKLDSHSTNDGT